MFTVTQLDMHCEVDTAKQLRADSLIEELVGIVETNDCLLLVKIRYCVTGEVDHDPSTGTTTAMLIPIFISENRNLSMS